LNTQTQENKEYEKQYKIENPEINDIQKQLFELMQSDPDTSRIAKDPENHFANRLLTCKKCHHEFDRQTAMSWQKIAKKFGNEKAIQEYKKL
jgi:cytochrome c551/c552